MGPRWAVAAFCTAVLAVGAAPGQAVAGPEVTVRRLAGATRFETAAALSASADRPTIAILVRADDFADGLAASWLSERFTRGAPILLVGREEVGAATLGELARLDAREVVIVGSEDVIAASVEDDLEAAGYEVGRYAGRDRYETAVRLASTFRDEGQSAAYLVSGTSYPDGLVVGAAAAALGVPVLLTTPHSLHPVVADYLTNSAMTQQVVIVGGPAAVSDDVRDAVEGICHNGISCVDVERIAGADRSETSVRFAENPGLGTARRDIFGVNLARGDAFPDALAGASEAGLQFEPVLLTPSPTVLGDPVRRWLEDHAHDITGIDVYGDETAVADAVIQEAVAAATP